MKRSARPAIAVLLGLLLAAASTEAEKRPYRDPLPLPIDVPVPPPIERAGAPAGNHAPADGVLASESAAVDFFGAEGQRVTYSLPPGPADNFSLFEVQCLGFSRGWSAGVELLLLDTRGEPLVQKTFEGGASFDLLFPQGNTQGEAATLVLSARRASLRYAVVRHGGFEPNRPGSVRDLDGHSRALGYLTDGAERVSFQLLLKDREALAVTVEPLRANARDGVHGARLAAVDAAVRAQPTTVEELDRLLAQAGTRDSRRQGPAHFWPAVVLPRAGTGSEHARQRIEFVAGPERVVRFDVLSRSGDVGGLFQLCVERDPDAVAVAGRVGDLSDDPRPGVAVRLLLEPELETAAHAVTDGEGLFLVRVPPGEYSLLTFDGHRTLRSHTRIQADGQLNLVHEPDAGD